MRITTFMLYKQFAQSLSKNLSELGRVQEQLATGRRLTKPSDDVIATRGSMAYKVSLNAIEQYNRNIDEGIGMLALTEISIRSSTNLLNRARELALSESNDTATPDTRKIASYEVRNLFNELIDLGNTKLKNRYIFSGYKTSTKSFDSRGAYQGDSSDIEIFIGEGVRTRINITGDSAFSDNTKLITDDLTGQVLSGNIRITTGSGTPLYLDSSDAFTGSSPEEIRDTINAPMTGTYDSSVSETIGTGTLTLRAGTGSPVSLTVDSTNSTPTLLRDAINTLNMGIKAGMFRDAAGNERLFFRPSTTGENISIEVSNDGDGNDIDTNGLSALLNTELRSNLTTNALGIEAFIINNSSGKRLLFTPNTPNTDFTIEVDEGNDGNFADPDDVDTSSPDGLALLYHASSATTNLNNSISFFTILDHLRNSLANDDSEGIRSSLLLIDGALDSSVNTTADIGSRLRYLEQQKYRHEENEVNFKTSLSALQDADIAEVAMEMTKIQSTLESMRISSIRSLSQSLFDFLA